MIGRIVMVMACVFGVACGNKGDDAKSAAGSGSAGSGSAANTGSSGSGSAAAPTPPADAAVAALSPKIKAARCGEPCLFLVDTPLDKLVETYKTECGGMETKDLGFDDCKQLDYVRNCIYAAHGLVYKKPRWQQKFAAKPWYEPHPDANAKTLLSELELANVHELNTRGKACKKGVSISAADAARVDKWLAGFPGRLAAPKLVYNDADVIDGAELVRKIANETNAKKLKLGKTAHAWYSTTESLPDAITKALASAGALRVLELELANVDDAGKLQEFGPMHLALVYDAKDQLQAAYLFWIEDGE